MGRVDWVSDSFVTVTVVCAGLICVIFDTKKTTCFLYPGRPMCNDNLLFIFFKDMCSL